MELANLAKGGKSVHHGHLDIQRNHVWTKLWDTRECGGAVAFRAHNFDIRFLAECVHHEVPDDNAIVHYQDADLAMGRMRPA